MNSAFLALCLSLCGQTSPTPPVLPPLPRAAAPVTATVPASIEATAPTPIARADFFGGNEMPASPEITPSYSRMMTPVPAIGATFPGTDAAEAPLPAALDSSLRLDPNAPADLERTFSDARRMFESDHAFDGFTGPLSNPVQFKDPRSLTEARFLFMSNYSRASTPVIGKGTAQVYALQLRLALTERLQLFADKDGIVRLSPGTGKSVTGLANLAAGLKYVWIRDVENQFLFSTAVQYEAPSGYANIFQNQGSGTIGVYGILGKEFNDNYHFLLQFGQNVAVQNQQSGYFLTALHLDRRFGRITPFYEANWFYYNQPGKFLPLGIEGGGWINLGSHNIQGMNYVTNAIGVKVDLTKNMELGVGYEFQLSDRTQLFNNMIHAQLLYRF
jgi:hypothetical protein